MANAREDADSDGYDSGAETLGKRRRGVDAVPQECPYLGSIDRSALDFDFEKLCSRTMAVFHVYACLVCGHFFQGRGPESPAYFHSMDSDHHVFIHLDTKRVYCLPDNYEVADASLQDIKYNVDPAYTAEEIAALDRDARARTDLHGRTYIPGFIGLNNIKNNDYLNAVVQALAHVRPLRDWALRGKKSDSNVGIVRVDAATGNTALTATRA